MNRSATSTNLTVLVVDLIPKWKKFNIISYHLAHISSTIQMSSLLDNPKPLIITTLRDRRMKVKHLLTIDMIIIDLPILSM